MQSSNLPGAEVLHVQCAKVFCLERCRCVIRLRTGGDISFGVPKGVRNRFAFPRRDPTDPTAIAPLVFVAPVLAAPHPFPEVAGANPPPATTEGAMYPPCIQPGVMVFRAISEEGDPEESSWTDEPERGGARPRFTVEKPVLNLWLRPIIPTTVEAGAEK